MLHVYKGLLKALVGSDLMAILPLSRAATQKSSICLPPTSLCSLPKGGFSYSQLFFLS